MNLKWNLNYFVRWLYYLCQPVYIRVCVSITIIALCCLKFHLYPCDDYVILGHACGSLYICRLKVTKSEFPLNRDHPYVISFKPFITLFFINFGSFSMRHFINDHRECVIIFNYFVKLSIVRRSCFPIFRISCII